MSAQDGQAQNGPETTSDGQGALFGEGGGEGGDGKPVQGGGKVTSQEVGEGGAALSALGGGTAAGGVGKKVFLVQPESNGRFTVIPAQPEQHDTGT